MPGCHSKMSKGPRNNTPLVPSWMEERVDWKADHKRLSDCLHVIRDADPNTTIEAVRSVAYDIVMNLITPDVAEHQLRVRSGLPPKP